MARNISNGCDDFLIKNEFYESKYRGSSCGEAIVFAEDELDTITSSQKFDIIEILKNHQK